MPTVTVLIVTRFRSTAERVAEWLLNERYRDLFLDLPDDLTNFIRAYVDGEMLQEELWRSYGYLTGLREPFIRALRYVMDPILDLLPSLRHGISELEVHCYQDLEYHIEASRLSEKLLLLETSERVRSRIKTGDWRKLLGEELELATEGVERAVGNIVEEAGKYSRNIVLYGGFIRPFKRLMETRGFKVESIYFQRYWRSPLDALRTIQWAYGVDNVPDEMILRCVKDHLSYLDYVLSSENADTAHDRWTSDTLPKGSCKTKIVV